MCTGFLLSLAMAKAQWTTLGLQSRYLSKILLLIFPMSNTLIATYTENQVQTYTSLITEDFKIISSFGLSKVHEIFFPKENDGNIKFKKLSSDGEYTSAKIQIIKTTFKDKTAKRSTSDNMQVNQNNSTFDESKSKVTEIDRKR